MYVFFRFFLLFIFFPLSKFTYIDAIHARGVCVCVYKYYKYGRSEFVRTRRIRIQYTKSSRISKKKKKNNFFFFFFCRYINITTITHFFPVCLYDLYIYRIFEVYYYYCLFFFHSLQSISDNEYAYIYILQYCYELNYYPFNIMNIGISSHPRYNDRNKLLYKKKKKKLCTNILSLQRFVRKFLFTMYT